MYCTSCGAKIAETSRFCAECGAETGRVVSSNANLQNNERAQGLFTGVNRKRNIGIAVIAAILAFAFFTPSFGKDSPTQVAEQFIEYTIDREWDQARELWADDGIDYLLANLGDERWINQSMMNLAHRYPLDGPATVLKSYPAAEEEIQGDEAMVLFEFLFDDGRQERAAFSMIKEDGQWKVYAFNTSR